MHLDRVFKLSEMDKILVEGNVPLHLRIYFLTMLIRGQEEHEILDMKLEHLQRLWQLDNLQEYLKD